MGKGELIRRGLGEASISASVTSALENVLAGRGGGQHLGESRGRRRAAIERLEN